MRRTAATRTNYKSRVEESFPREIRLNWPSTVRLLSNSFCQLSSWPNEESKRKSLSAIFNNKIAKMSWKIFSPDYPSRILLHQILIYRYLWIAQRCYRHFREIVNALYYPHTFHNFVLSSEYFTALYLATRKVGRFTMCNILRKILFLSPTFERFTIWNFFYYFFYDITFLIFENDSIKLLYSVVN